MELRRGVCDIDCTEQNILKKLGNNGEYCERNDRNRFFKMKVI